MICDFGISKRVRNGKDEMKGTNGTPSYVKL
jgi:hypothetical protein